MNNPHATHTDFYEFRGLITSNPKAVPSNIDMVFERKGKFLIGEWKRPGEKISLGQEILLKQLAKQKNFTVLIINGNTDNGMVVNEFSWVNTDGTISKLGSSVQELKERITHWYNIADKGEL